jgi:hypothetical protein
MLKHVLLASAFIVSTPALAQVQDTTQTMPADTETTVPVETQTAPAQDPSALPDTAAPADSSQAATATPDQMTQATDPAQPAATTGQVAQAVDQSFPTYDADGDGTLSETEFAAWMTELRTASDPSVKAGSAEMTAWAGKAFAAADTDKNTTLSKGEVTAFLSQGAS